MNFKRLALDLGQQESEILISQNSFVGSVHSPQISAFFATANKMPRELYENTFCHGTSLATPAKT